MNAADILGPSGPIAKSVREYEHRPGQMAMGRAVESVLRDDGVLIVEAGTGTGKTWAYLIPAIESGRRVIVSTGTRALQDQIMRQDLPALERALGREVNATCMKGLNNYLCLRRYNAFASSSAALEAKLGGELRLLDSWARTTDSGDRSDLDALPEDAAIWSHVTSGPDTRIGPRCPHYDACHVTKMRNAAAESQLVVVNHHLFFADLSLRGPHGASVIPDYDAVIFDEAHQLEDVATLHFGERVSIGMLERFVRDSRATLSDEPARDVERLVGHVLQTASNFFATLSPPREGGRAPLVADELSSATHDTLLALDNALDSVAHHCRNHQPATESVLQLARRADRLRNALVHVLEAQTAKRVAWLQGAGAKLSLGTSPVDMSETLRDELFYRTPAIVLTSATLSTGGDCSFLKRSLGIDFDVQEAFVESPFDYAKNAALYVPDDLPDPRDPAFFDAALDRITALVGLTGGGAFVLCTSHRMMRKLAKAFRARASQPSWVQGEAPKHALLDAFRASADGVLFATASFWEGVDVPGHALRLVVIDKLPFDVPTDPVVAARCALLKEQGESPFMRYLVPSAALALKQGFGRLIRTQRDHGVVAVLDSRLRRKSYGKLFFRSLPPATRCDTLEEVRAFWARPFEL